MYDACKRSDVESNTWLKASGIGKLSKGIDKYRNKYRIGYKYKKLNWTNIGTFTNIRPSVNPKRNRREKGRVGCWAKGKGYKKDMDKDRP